jgi:hypothetical protein
MLGGRGAVLRRRAERALAELGAAAPLGAVCLLVANDHQLKRLLHNALTGKLSDLAICFLLPLLVSAALGLVSNWSGRRRLAAGALVTTSVFTLLELSDVAGALFVRAIDALGLGSGPLTRDPSDLLALACVPLALAYGRRRLAAVERGPSVWRTATGALVMVAGSLALMADSDTVKPCGQDVTIQAEAGCGPGGPIVFRGGASDPPQFVITNPAALGLPPFYASDHCALSTGYLKGAASSDGAAQCPFKFDKGEITVYECLYSNGVVASAPACANCTWVIHETCSAVLAGGEGSVTCSGVDGGPPSCVSSLTPARDGGADVSVTDAAAMDEPVVDGSSERAGDGSSDFD